MSLCRHIPKSGEEDLDLTPCSDIIFTLLLFYILTQSFQSHFPLQLPSLKTGEHRSGASERLEITASGTILWSGNPLRTDWECDVRQRAARLSSSTSIILSSHRQAPAGILVELLDRLRNAGVHQVAFAGVPKATDLEEGVSGER